MKTFQMKGCPSCGVAPVITYWHDGIEPPEWTAQVRAFREPKP